MMKNIKNFSIPLVIMLLTAVVVWSCSKSKIEPQATGECKSCKTKDKKSKDRFGNDAGRFRDSTSVNSTYNFLVFPDLVDADEYMDFVRSSTHGQVQGYLDTLGFASMGHDLYGEEYSNQTVDSAQVEYYLYNTSRMVQIKNIIIRPIDSTDCEIRKYNFLLAMVPNNLNNSSYESMAGGTYDGGYMNKIAINPADTSFKLEEYMASSPAGNEDLTAAPCTSEDARPFWRDVCFATQWEAIPGTNCRQEVCTRLVKYRFLLVWSVEDNVPTDTEPVCR